MNDINLNDSSQAQSSRSDTCVVIHSELQLSCMCKTSLLFAPLAVSDHTGFSVSHSSQTVDTITY